MTYLNNPAGRLLANFQQFRALPNGTRAITAWAKIFNIDENDRPAFMVRVAKLFQFAEETRELIAAIPEAAPGIYLRHFDEVENTLTHFMVIRDINVEQFLSLLSPKSGEFCLEICSHLLHVQRPERTVSDHDRESLLERLDDLVDTVAAASDLDDEVKGWILARLAEIRATLSERHLFSADDTESAVDKMLGGLKRKVRYLSSLTKSGAATKFIAFALAIDVAINIAANSHELTAGNEPKPSPIVVEIQNQISPQETVPALPVGSTGEDAKPR